jgi:hypothetical protein
MIVLWAVLQINWPKWRKVMEARTVSKCESEEQPLLAEAGQPSNNHKMADSQLTPTLVLAILGAVLGMFYFGYNTGVVRYRT